MEICYIWIKRYRKFEAQGFTFSPDLEFSYNEENKNLSICFDKDGYLPDFLKCQSQNSIKDNIIQLTAIIGKNGTGKTSILQFLWDWKYHWEGVGIEYFIVMRDSTKRFYIFESIPDNLVKKIKDGTTEKTIQIHREHEFQKYFTPIVYGNIFQNSDNFQSLRITQGQSGPIEMEDQVNLTLDFLAKKDIVRHVNSDYREADFEKYIDPFDAHRRMESKRWLFALKENNLLAEKEKFIPFKIEGRLEVHFLRHDHDWLTKQKRRKSGSKYWKEVDILIEKMERQKNTQKIPYLFDLRKSYIYHHLRVNSSDNAPFSSWMPDSFPDLNDSNAFKLYLELIQDNNIISYLFKGYSELEEAHIKLVIKVEKEWEREYGQGFLEEQHLRVPVGLHEQAYKYLECYINTDPINDFIAFEMGGLSSGEQSLISLFGRFYYSMKEQEVRGGKNWKDNLLILLDEGEVHYHPEWQRKYLKSILFFFNKAFSKYKIQLVLTSHSPYLVSDLTRNHIIFLDSDDETGMTVVTDGPDMERTFGSNIHTLLADAFFMGDQQLGEFATEKIQQLINKINGLKSNSGDAKDEKELILKWVESIGEPIFRLELKRMLAESESDIDLKILALEEEIERLKEQKD